MTYQYIYFYEKEVDQDGKACDRLKRNFLFFFWFLGLTRTSERFLKP